MTLLEWIEIVFFKEEKNTLRKSEFQFKLLLSEKLSVFQRVLSILFASLLITEKWSKNIDFERFYLFVV